MPFLFIYLLQTELVELLAEWSPLPVTYAGGARTLVSCKILVLCVMCDMKQRRMTHHCVTYRPTWTLSSGSDAAK